MGRATAGERRTPRLLSRALLLLGGATAATAAAWLLSSQTASADPLPSVPPASVATVQAMSTSDTAGAPFETPLSTTVSSVADPVTDTGSTAVSAVTEPSRHAALPLPTVPGPNPAGLDQLTTGLRGTVGQLGDRLPVERDLPTQLVQHLSRTPVSTPAAPNVAVPVSAPAAAPHHITVQDGPFAGEHSRIGGVAGSTAGSFDGARGRPHAPPNPGSVPFGPLTVPAMPGSGGGTGSGFAGPAGLGLTTGDAEAIVPELHVVDVLTPATEPVAVLPGKQPGVTPD